MAELFDLRRGQAEPSLYEQAYSRLRSDILSGVIRPSERLKIHSLQRRYELSNTPLREALTRLTAEGLVVSDDRRGFRAAPMSVEDFRDLIDHRLVLEEGALTASIGRGGDDWEAAVVAAHHKLEAGPGGAGPRALDEMWSRNHKAFHLALVSACGSRRMLLACSKALDEAERYRCLSSRSGGPMRRHSSDEHRTIMEAVLDRDAALAVALHRRHVLRTAQSVIEILTERAAADGS